MFKVYIETLDSARLQSRLDTLLENGGIRVPHNRYLNPPAGGGVRRLAGRWPWLRRLASLHAGWKLSGWSLRWLVRRLPVLGPLAWRIHGVLTQREFRARVLSELAHLNAGQQALRAELASSRQALQEAQASQAAAQADAVDGLRSAHLALQRQAGHTATRLHDFERRLAPLLQSGALAESPLFPDWYLALENSLRGDMADIGERLKPYLAHLACAQVGQPDWPVLDLGCGRGEWLALLGRHGFTARGVDTNEAMLEEARRQGLDVRRLDLLSALNEAETSSIGAITAFQVVEHIDLATLLELFRQARRVLHPGGVLLLETPNPENIQVGAYSFWLDPTHVRPLPPPLLTHSAAHFGFTDIAIVRSNPWREGGPATDGDETGDHLRKLMFGDQDYALIARKPYE
jgi:O-antigen chain-terminating methyltransferase